MNKKRIRINSPHKIRSNKTQMDRIELDKSRKEIVPKADYHVGDRIIFRQYSSRGKHSQFSGREILGMIKKVKEVSNEETAVEFGLTAIVKERVTRPRMV